MRLALAFSFVFGVLFLTSAAVTAAPLALSDHATVTKAVGATSAVVEEAGWRARARRCGRPYARSYCCTWTCYPYWRPYQYYNWQYYYPYGGPLF